MCLYVSNLLVGTTYSNVFLYFYFPEHLFAFDQTINTSFNCTVSVLLFIDIT